MIVQYVVQYVAQGRSQRDRRRAAARAPIPHQRQSFQGVKRCPT